MTARKLDSNGWFEVKKNPISKVGVFPYLGSSIGAPDPDQIYMVYRPAEELGDKEAMRSMELIPWVDDHTMIGPGFEAAEKKGVHGVTGQEIEFDGETLYANIKLFSETQAALVDSGKEELSLGYKCKYDYTPGEFKGQKYDVVQRKVRGNHLASVQEGRMGPDVAVLDQALTLHDPTTVFTIDSKDIVMTKKTDGEQEAKTTIAMDSAELSKMIAESVTQGVKVAMDEMMKEKKDGMDKDYNGKDEEKKKGMDEEMSEKKEGMDEEEKKKSMDKGHDEEKEKGMDAAEVAKLNATLKATQDSLDDLKKNGFKQYIQEVNQRDAMYKQLSPFVGAFDHQDMTLQEVAAKGVKDLEIPCQDGMEIATLQAYLSGRESAPQEPTFVLNGTGQDGANQSSVLDSYLAGE